VTLLTSTVQVLGGLLPGVERESGDRERGRIKGRFLMWPLGGRRVAPR
jgi:hypothetical protein